MSQAGFRDHYETLQISPSAEQETIQRVYRMLAQRYHPDNHETGDEGKFRELTEAYRVLGDPELRPQYDVEYHSRQSLRWRVFDERTAADGFESDKQIRRGILSLLYAKRRAEPANPGVSLLELENLLGRAREHLEFSIWFLKEKGYVGRTDDSFLMITADGVEYVEEAGLGKQMQKLLEHKNETPGGANGA